MAFYVKGSRNGVLLIDLLEGGRMFIFSYFTFSCDLMFDVQIMFTFRIYCGRETEKEKRNYLNSSFEEKKIL